MKRGILLVDHGSRVTEANQVIEQLATRLAQRLAGDDGDTLVRIAHLELATPDIADAVAELAASGVDEVVVYPHFLAPGRHSQRDIPALLARAAEPYSSLRVLLAEPLGAHEGLVELMLERIDAATTLVRKLDV